MDAARQKLRQFGPNYLPEPAARSPLAMLLHQFCSLPVALLGVYAGGLSVDESALTGKSYPVAKQAGALAERELPLCARANMAYMGTFVSAGNGLGIAR